MGSPGSRAEDLRTCAGSQTTRDRVVSCVTKTTHVAFREYRLRRHPEVFPFAAQYLARTSPVNASPSSSRTPPHDSGPMWLARPSSHGTCIHYPLPVCRRTYIENKYVGMRLPLGSDDRTHTPPTSQIQLSTGKVLPLCWVPSYVDVTHETSEWVGNIRTLLHITASVP